MQKIDRQLQGLRLSHAQQLLPTLESFRQKLERTGQQSVPKERIDELRDLSKYTETILDTDQRTFCGYVALSPTGFKQFKNGGISPRRKTTDRIIGGLIRAVNDYMNSCKRNAIEPLIESRWVEQESLSNVELLGQLAKHLAEMVERVRSLNTPSEDSVLSDLERTQLVNLLKRALEILESPQIEVGTFKRIRHRLFGSAQKSVEKQVDLAFGEAARRGVELLDDIMKGF